MEFRTVMLPDDPALAPNETKARAFKNSKRWSRAGSERIIPRSVTKNHQSHFLFDRMGKVMNK